MVTNASKTHNIRIRSGDCRSFPFFPFPLLFNIITIIIDLHELSDHIMFIMKPHTIECFHPWRYCISFEILSMISEIFTHSVVSICWHSFWIDEMKSKQWKRVFEAYAKLKYINCFSNAKQSPHCIHVTHLFLLKKSFFLFTFGLFQNTDKNLISLIRLPIFGGFFLLTTLLLFLLMIFVNWDNHWFVRRFGFFMKTKFNVCNLQSAAGYNIKYIFMNSIIECNVWCVLSNQHLNFMSHSDKN